MHVLNYNKILSHMYPLMSSVIAYLYCCWLYCIVGYLLHQWTCFEWHTLYTIFYSNNLSSATVFRIFLIKINKNNVLRLEPFLGSCQLRF